MRVDLKARPHKVSTTSVFRSQSCLKPLPDDRVWKLVIKNQTVSKTKCSVSLCPGGGTGNCVIYEPFCVRIIA